MENKFILINNLEVYKLARELSKIGWGIYQNLDWRDKKIIGDQFIESTDSVGANIAEGYARYHFLEKIKFYYNARGSLVECANHWLELLYERDKVVKEEYNKFKMITEKLSLKLNNFIQSTYRSKENDKFQKISTNFN